MINLLYISKMAMYTMKQKFFCFFLSHSVTG
nr:MAG TPA: hypothetical protein [Caudoviricetes sp.]